MKNTSRCKGICELHSLRNCARVHMFLFSLLSLYIFCMMYTTDRTLTKCNHRFKSICHFIYGATNVRTFQSREKVISPYFKEPPSSNKFTRNSSRQGLHWENQGEGGTITSFETSRGHIPRNATSKGSTDCSIERKFMPKRSMPYVALLSVPGSGNTWLRYLIEGVTGIYTGSIYEDPQLTKGGFLGEREKPRSGRVVVVKMHVIKSGKSVDRIIYLIRNPYDAITADYNRLSTNSKSHIDAATEDAFKSEKWAMFAKWAALRWEKSVEKYMKMVDKDKLVIYYEDMLASGSLSHQLRKIVSFLNLTLDERRLECILMNKEGNFHRKHQTLTFDPFSDEISAVVERAIRNARQVMKTFGGPPMKPYERYNGTKLYDLIQIAEDEIICPICKRFVQW